MGIAEEQQREKGTESQFTHIVDENFPNQWIKLYPRIQEANRTPNYLNQKGPSPRHIVFKLSKINDKERILKGKPISHHWTSQQKLYKLEESGTQYSNY